MVSILFNIIYILYYIAHSLNLIVRYRYQSIYIMSYLIYLIEFIVYKIIIFDFLIILKIDRALKIKFRPRVSIIYAYFERMKHFQQDISIIRLYCKGTRLLLYYFEYIICRLVYY